MGTLVSDRKLFLTERREARICANGVTMRSSPWLQDQTGKDQFSCSFLMCVKRDTTRRGGGSMGEHSGLRWTQRVSQKLLSKFMQGVWRSLSVANCTPVSLWSRYDLVPIPISSEQKQRNWNGPPSSNHSFYKSILRRKRERVMAGVERERSMKEGGGDRNLFSLFVSQSLSSRRKEKIFVRFWWNHGWKPFKLSQSKFIYKRKQRNSKIYNIRGCKSRNTRPIHANFRFKSITG